MNKQAAIIFAHLLFLSGAHASEPNFQPSYIVRTGDLNNDGRTDIYVRRLPRLASFVDETPIFGGKHNPEFVLQQNSTGNFSIVGPLSSTQKAAVKSWTKQTGIEIKPYDFNFDGVVDLLIRKVASVISGSHNAILFWPNASSLTPSSIANIDARLTNFITDIGGFADNPNYFQAGVSVQCSTNFVAWYHYDHETNTWSSTSTPVQTCTYAFDPNVNIDSAIVLSGLNTALGKGRYGELVAQSSDAESISNTLQDLFDVPFFANALSTGGAEGTTCEYAPGPAWEICAKRDRMRQLLEMLRELALGGLDDSQCAPAGPHHWQLIAGEAPGAEPICTVGASNCSSSNVFKEQLVHPAPGWSFNNTPVYQNQRDTTWGQGVTFLLDKPNLTHVNQTLPDHKFHPGTVTRRTVTYNGKLYINSVGDGTGACKYLNEKIGPLLFSRIDQWASNDIQQGVVTLHDNVPP